MPKMIFFVGLVQPHYPFDFAAIQARCKHMTVFIGGRPFYNAMDLKTTYDHIYNHDNPTLIASQIFDFDRKDFNRFVSLMNDMKSTISVQWPPNDESYPGYYEERHVKSMIWLEEPEFF